MNETNEAVLLPLQQLYLMSIAMTLEGELQLQCVLQDFSRQMPDSGRLWLVPKGNSTVPRGWIAFRFDVDAVRLDVYTRDERELPLTVRYAEGLDGFLERMLKHLRAGLLDNPDNVTALAPKRGGRKPSVRNS